MKHSILLLFVYIALTTELAKSEDAKKAWRTTLKCQHEPAAFIKQVNSKERRSTSNLETISQDHQSYEKSAQVAGSDRKHSKSEQNLYGTSAQESDNGHHTEAKSNHYRSNKHHHSKKGSRKDHRRLEHHLESGYKQKKGNKNNDNNDNDSRYEKHHHKKDTVTHTLEHKKQGIKTNTKATPSPPTQNTWQNTNPLSGLGYGAFPYNRLPFLPPVPVMYQPTPQQKNTNTVPTPPTILPHGGNSLLPVENMKMLEDMYLKFGDALRQLQNARNSNLNNAQHVTYIVPYVRRLEHLYAAMYNQLLNTLAPYDPMYTRQMANYISSYRPPVFYDPLKFNSYQPLPVQVPFFPMRYRSSMTKNELLHELQLLLDRNSFNQQRIVLPVDMHRNQEPVISPSVKLDYPHDIHYYLKPASAGVDHVPTEHSNDGPVEIHYHLPPQSEIPRKTPEEGNHYHMYLPQQKQAKSNEKIMTDKINEELNALLDRLSLKKRSNVQDHKQYQPSMRLNTPYPTQLLSRQATHASK